MTMICQPEAHWFLNQKILLFYSWQIWITKAMFVKSDASYGPKVRTEQL